MLPNFLNGYQIIADDVSSQNDWMLVLKLAVDTSNIHSDNGILTSDH